MHITVDSRGNTELIAVDGTAFPYDGKEQLLILLTRIGRYFKGAIYLRQVVLTTKY